eukprot:COSAG02_NODE_505_length_20935_cov_38.509119_11_plen_87_part_00
MIGKKTQQRGKKQRLEGVRGVHCSSTMSFTYSRRIQAAVTSITQMLTWNSQPGIGMVISRNIKRRGSILYTICAVCIGKSYYSERA